MKKQDSGMWKLFSFTLLQIFIPVAVGFVYIFFSTVGNVYSDVTIKNKKVKVHSYKEFESLLNNEYSKDIEKKHVSIKYDNNMFKINLRDIQAEINYDLTRDKLYGKTVEESIFFSISNYFKLENINFIPVISFNNEKLKNKIREISNQINVNAENSDVILHEGSIILQEEKVGIVLNEKKVFEKVLSDVSSDFTKNIEIVLNQDEYFQTVYPNLRIEKIQSIDKVVSSSEIWLSEVNTSETFQDKINKIEKIVILPSIHLTTIKKEKFALKDYLEGNNIDFTVYGYALYESLIGAGFKEHDIKVEFSDTDFEAYGSGVRFDEKKILKSISFYNSLREPIVIFSSIKDNKLIIEIGA